MPEEGVVDRVVFRPRICAGLAMPRPLCYKTSSKSLRACLCDEPLLLAQCCLTCRARRQAAPPLCMTSCGCSCSSSTSRPTAARSANSNKRAHTFAVRVCGCRLPRWSPSRSRCSTGRHPRGHRTPPPSVRHTPNARCSPVSPVGTSSITQACSASSQACPP
ncbi:uncharacterized protein C8Q71DRAFT_285717 [Rhodofomes roseus]|uniref:Uncharacterized protein n=1 Tax=Rhodofomes roseus TaxID=34475 RepID=A0ABQ8K4K5_9APHY|nr:uncharacterized protein C8Q71DRAFT_285717 [Rhodofomes roseus]KAH9831796.1 hypothetical protein C8Q71DRAFT_285717 [Rhodofomes roseus]